MAKTAFERKLTIKGDDKNLKAYIQYLDNNLPPTWKKHGVGTSDPSIEDHIYIDSRKGDVDRMQVCLRRERGQIYLRSIKPLDRSDAVPLSEYNELLEQYEKEICPALTVPMEVFFTLDPREADATD